MSDGFFVLTRRRSPEKEPEAPQEVHALSLSLSHGFCCVRRGAVWLAPIRSRLAFPFRVGFARCLYFSGACGGRALDRILHLRSRKAKA